MRLIVTGGGTGGHLFPGIAIAEAIIARFPETEVLFVSTDRSIDNKALAERPFRRAALPCRPLKGTRLFETIRNLAGLPASLGRAIRLVRDFRPDLVFGVGGYVTGPVVLAARLCRIKTCIHEQNSVPGLANRILGRLVDRVCISFPGSERFFPAKKTVLTGNPVRAELIEAARLPLAAKERQTLLVLGGSQGAHRVNQLVIEALCGGAIPARLRVLHQSGAKDYDWLRQAYLKAGVDAEVLPFIADMASAYREADLVVSRAGATTIAELTLMGKPAILIPYPYAADDHQTGNAALLAAGGAARLRQERSLDGPRLRREIAELFSDREQLFEMGRRMKDYARPDAGAAILAESLKLLGQ